MDELGKGLKSEKGKAIRGRNRSLGRIQIFKKSFETFGEIEIGERGWRSEREVEFAENDTSEMRSQRKKKLNVIRL